MMEFYYLGPEIVDGYGDKKIAEGECSLKGWRGDPLVSAGSSIFLVTKALQERIESTLLSGVAFLPVKIARTKVTQPEFVRLRVTGEAGKDDFGIAADDTLVVSERALDILELAGLSYADIVTFDAKRHAKPTLLN